MKKVVTLLAAVLCAIPILARADSAPSYSPPFGMWRVPEEQYGILPLNLNGVAFSQKNNTPADVFKALDAARAHKMHIFISLVNFADLEESPSGNFSLANWQARYNAWCKIAASGARSCMDLRSYVADKTLLGVHLFEYSRPPGILLGRYTPSLGQIDQIAAYVKTLWPYLPTAIDTSHPCELARENWNHGNVDIALVTLFTIRLMDFSAGERFLDRDVACAKQAGLRYAILPNPFGGTQQGLSPTGLSSFRHFAEYAILYPGTQATIIWRWWPSEGATVTNGHQTFANFWSESLNPGVGAAMREIETCALRRTPQACPSAQPGGTAQSN